MDWQLTCRVCLETGDMVSLFDWDENNEQLGDKYSYCCGVEVSKNDSLPTLICLNCVDRLTYAYQFKQQCISSNDTLKECLQEFLKTSAAVPSGPTDTETITIKQENGLLLQYELPVEHDPQAQWTRTLIKTPSTAVVTKAPGPRRRGRPRKYPNEQGQIDVSPYQRKKPKHAAKESEAITTMLESGRLDFKEEPSQEEDAYGDGNDGDPDFEPGPDEPESDPEIKVEPVTPKKRGRPRKNADKRKEDDSQSEDVLLKETILAFSEPIPEHILNPKPKKRKPQQRKKYIYEKSHICETCGASFSSNASLQAHIRRHLGIKPFVCSVCGYACVLNMELRRHMMRHTGVRPYKCRVCDRRFGDFGSRQKHERLHMGLRPYQCTLCGKSFTYSYVLANHMLTHTGEKKYSCAPCNKKFTKAHHLKYHNKVHHKEVYLQQQLEQEAKKIRQQLNVSNLSGVISGQIVDGTLQLIQAPSEVLELMHKRERRLTFRRKLQRKRYALLKADPELYEEAKMREKIRYDQRKKMGQLASINERSKKEQEIQRQKWREACERYREKKKAEAEARKKKKKAKRLKSKKVELKKTETEEQESREIEEQDSIEIEAEYVDEKETEINDIKIIFLESEFEDEMNEELEEVTTDSCKELEPDSCEIKNREAGEQVVENCNVNPLGFEEEVVENCNVNPLGFPGEVVENCYVNPLGFKGVLIENFNVNPLGFEGEVVEHFNVNPLDFAERVAENCTVKNLEFQDAVLESFDINNLEFESFEVDNLILRN